MNYFFHMLHIVRSVGWNPPTPSRLKCLFFSDFTPLHQVSGSRRSKTPRWSRLQVSNSPFSLNIYSLDEETSTSPRNAMNQLPSDAAPHPRITEIFNHISVGDQKHRKLQNTEPLSSNSANKFITKFVGGGSQTRTYRQLVCICSCRGNQNTHFMFNNFFYRKSCRLWDN